MQKLSRREVIGLAEKTGDVSGCDLSGIDLSNLILIAVRFAGSNLKGANLSKSGEMYESFRVVQGDRTWKRSSPAKK